MILVPVETVTKLTNELVASYARLGGINHLDGKNLPSKRVVTELTCSLLRLLFPGFFDEKLIHSSEIKVETAALLDSIIGTLEDEIRKALEYQPPAGLAKKDITSAAHTLTVEFLESRGDDRAPTRSSTSWSSCPRSGAK